MSTHEAARSSLPVVIVVQQESLRERPRIHKLTRILTECGQPFEVWKFRGTHSEASEAPYVRNLVTWDRKRGGAVFRYAKWMLAVFVEAWKRRGTCHFYAVGFDSAFPMTFLPLGNNGYAFDNIDNISLSYRWPRWMQPFVQWLEVIVANRARLHIVPSKVRWRRAATNLREVTNTPSASVIRDAQEIAKHRRYTPGEGIAIYLNGWLSSTRGIRTLLVALELLEQDGIHPRVLVAGRIACEDAERLVGLKCTEYLGMLTNVEALAAYYRCHVAYTYYDPSIAINRLAESQKWTDCWATGTPFICNVEVETIAPYVRAGACLTAPYSDSRALSALFAELSKKPERLHAVRRGLSQMAFQYWDDEMRKVIGDWLLLRKAS